METSAIVMMMTGFGVTWGGAIWCLRLAIRKHLAGKE